MSGEKGANLAPKEVCIGGAGEIGACGEGNMGFSVTGKFIVSSFIKATEVTIK